MALPDSALTTWETIQGELKLAATDQTACERIINVATAAIERYCGRTFYKRELVERLQPSGMNRLVLTVKPIASITNVVDDGTVISSSEYTIEDAAAGFLWRDAGWPVRELLRGISGDGEPNSSKRALVVAYIGGYVTPTMEDLEADPQIVRDLPQDLEQACIEVAASLWRRRGIDRQATAYSETNQAIGRNVAGLIPDSIVPLLAKYRVLA